MIVRNASTKADLNSLLKMVCLYCRKSRLRFNKLLLPISFYIWCTLFATLPVNCDRIMYLKAPFDCYDAGKSLRTLEQQADVVLTGTVSQLVSAPNDYRESIAIVYVKRVFKGLDNISTRRRIRIYGIGDPKLCNSFVRIRDTKIFLLRKLPNGSLHLNSSLVPISLRNLDIIEAAVWDIPYKGRKPIKPKPCEIRQCGFGAVCKESERGKAHCECRNDCGLDVFAPVCGSDNVTYVSECHMQAKGCTQQRRIRIKFVGSCDAKDPCEELRCPFGARCVASVDGKRAQCICPQKCRFYGDSRGSRPVCGDDARDYDSHCHMHKESCKKSEEIQVKYVGRCDPCANITCPEGTICKLSSRREPECRCSQQCSLTKDLVCASDGNTYRNPCIMGVQACKERKELRVVYPGRCEDGSNPCARLKCDFGEDCYVDRFNYSSCQCLHICEPVMRPMCGKDGVTYENQCELERISCRNRSRNTAEHKGFCGVGACAKYHCPVGAVCVLRAGRPGCECPTCSDELKPVCANNGISYPNECKMRQEACRLHKRIFAAYDGYCDGCQDTVCDHYAICVSDGRGNGECRCPKAEECAENAEPVCGTDGHTYPNECALRVAACQRRIFIMVAAKGACDSCLKVTCPWGAACREGRCVCPSACPRATAAERVCASDGNIYRSQCYLLAATCKTGVTLTVDNIGRCPADRPPVDVSDSMAECSAENCAFAGMCVDVGGRAECVCDFECDVREHRPVCGSNGVLYKNACVMDKTSCRLQTPIYEEPRSRCLNMQNEMGDPVNCKTSEFGCCPNSSKPSGGAAFEGCPSGSCQCNKVGSYSETCDAAGSCTCKPGVGGRSCDHCRPGFFGMHLIHKGSIGCQPCACSVFGSQRDDCEQMTGRCVCRPGVTGMKCDTCAADYLLTSQGCVPISDYEPPQNCSQLLCHHYATCLLRTSGQPVCECPTKCVDPSTGEPYDGQGESEVCGSNGVSYGSLCQLQMFACRHQEDIVAVKFGSCNELKDGRTTSVWVPKSSRGVITNEISVEKQPSSTPYSVPKPVPGSLGSRCWDDKACKVRNSVCADRLGKRLCLCRRGYVPADDNSICVGKSSKESDLEKECAHRPCKNGGHCIVQPSHPQRFKCLCPLGYKGAYCEEAVAKKQLYRLPEFGGHSWLEFEKMDAYNRVRIELTFKPQESEGLILYNGQQNDKDFIAIVLLDRHVELRYNLGDSMIVLRSPDQIDLGSWHTLSASRRGRRGRLQVDRSNPVKTPKGLPGLNRHLNLNSSLYLGKVPKMPERVSLQAGTRYGFTGCIQSLKINDKIYDLRLTISADITNKHMMGECGINPCSSLPCLNGGICTMESDLDFNCRCPRDFTGLYCETPIDACAEKPCKYGGTCQVKMNTFFCICPAGRTGSTCELESSAEENEILVPEFHGRSYLELPPLPNEVDRTFTAELWILPFESTGLLLYSGKADDLLGNGGEDFIALALSQGKPQLTYNLGSGVANITGKKEVTINQWHRIKVHRTLRNGSLQVDDNPPVTGQSPPPWDKLNLDAYPLYVGGIRNAELLPALAGVSQGFKGVVQKLMLNSMVYDDLIKSAVLSSGVDRYEGPPCRRGLCKNGGVCIPRMSKFHCKCSITHTGQRCENKVNIEFGMSKSVRFDGQTILDYSDRLNETIIRRKENEIRLRFKTELPSGLLLWTNRGMTLRGDYLALAISEGRVVLSFNLGKEESFQQATSSVPVDDGRWHTVLINRSLRKAQLTVDVEPLIEMLAADGATELNTDGTLWFGGYAKLPMGLPSSYYLNFTGCMAEIRIDNRVLNLAQRPNIQFCKESPPPTAKRRS